MTSAGPVANNAPLTPAAVAVACRQLGFQDGEKTQLPVRCHCTGCKDRGALHRTQASDFFCMLPSPRARHAALLVPNQHSIAAGLFWPLCCITHTCNRASRSYHSILTCAHHHSCYRGDCKQLWLCIGAQRSGHVLTAPFSDIR